MRHIATTKTRRHSRQRSAGSLTAIILRRLFNDAGATIEYDTLRAAPERLNLEKWWRRGSQTHGGSSNNVKGGVYPLMYSLPSCRPFESRRYSMEEVEVQNA